MRILYSLAWLFLLPTAFVYLIWRSLRQPEYRRHWGERLGAAPKPGKSGPLIWLHAVSVGETRAAEPLIRQLLARYPQARLLLTHATPTGRATGSDLFGEQVTQAYLPYDLPILVARFLKRTRPALAIIMETEIWPNLYAACQDRNVPLYLVNCRLSERSARGYARFLPLLRPALATLSGLAAQTEADAERLKQLGARSVAVTGNMKFDVMPASDVGTRAAGLRDLFGDRFVWLAASTREGEEARILEVWQRLGLPDLLLVIVPRHPQRFEEVGALIRKFDPAMARRSQPGSMKRETRVFLGDSMGEMAAYYAACDLAFIGGSLLPYGCQNPIEAALAGTAILLGPHTWNFAAVTDELVDTEAARRVVDAQGLEKAVRELSQDTEARLRLGRNARSFVRRHQGATERVLALLEPALRRLP